MFNTQYLFFRFWPWKKFAPYDSRQRALQNKLTVAEVFPVNKALFHKSCVAVCNKQKLSRKRKLQKNGKNHKSGGYNMNLEDKEESKNSRKSLEFRKTLKMFFSVAKKTSLKIFINVKRCNYKIVLRMPHKISTISINCKAIWRGHRDE